jgi:hypothetical protein
MLDPKLKPTDWLVLRQLLEHLNTTTGECFPSDERIRSQIGTAREVVQRSRQRLRDAGYIDWPPSKGGRSIANRYAFSWHLRRTDLATGGQPSETVTTQAQFQGETVIASSRFPTPGTVTADPGNCDDPVRETVTARSHEQENITRTQSDRPMRASEAVVFEPTVVRSAVVPIDERQRADLARRIQRLAGHPGWRAEKARQVIDEAVDRDGLDAVKAAVEVVVRNTTDRPPAHVIEAALADGLAAARPKAASPPRPRPPQMIPEGLRDRVDAQIAVWGDFRDGQALFHRTDFWNDLTRRAGYDEERLLGWMTCDQQGLRTLVAWWFEAEQDPSVPSKIVGTTGRLKVWGQYRNSVEDWKQKTSPSSQKRAGNWSI